MALFEKFIDIPATQRSLEKEHDILDHVFIGDEVEESGQRFNSLSTQILELCYKL